MLKLSGFPTILGRNLNALNDCLRDVAAGDYGSDPPATGLVVVMRRFDLVVVMRRFDSFAAADTSAAHAVLDIFASQSRNAALIGRRLMCLVQTDDSRLTFAPVGATPVTWNDRMARLQARATPMSGLSDVWATRWPDCRPISYELRSCASDRWVRFHSLPESKRYPDSDAEWAELLRRHHIVLRELLETSTHRDHLIVITAAWTNTASVAKRDPDLLTALSDADPWTSVLVEREDDGFENWTHLFTSRVSTDVQKLDPLLGLVAGNGTGGVVISNAELEWLFCPYDGGADVIAATTADRDALRAKHLDWLSAHPLGL